MKKLFNILFVILILLIFSACSEPMAPEKVKLHETRSAIRNYRDEAVDSLSDYKKADYSDSIDLATNDALEYLPYCQTIENFQLVEDWHKTVVLYICTDQIYQPIYEEYIYYLDEFQDAEETILYEPTFIEEYQASYDSRLAAYKAELERQWGTIFPSLIEEFNREYYTTLTYHQTNLSNAYTTYQSLIQTLPSYEQSLSELEVIFYNLESKFISLNTELDILLGKNAVEVSPQ